MGIYKNWETDLSRRLWIEIRFRDKSYDENFYDAVLKTMRYIASYIPFDKSLKKDLHEVRNYYKSQIQY